MFLQPRFCRFYFNDITGAAQVAKPIYLAWVTMPVHSEL